MMISIIQVTLLSLFGLFTVYLFCLSILAIKEKNKKINAALKLRRFAIVVPAYNEEDCIADTIRNLCEINYSSQQYDVIVIADNCTDETASIAEDEGAIVWERKNPEKRGKGYALRWCFDQLMTKPGIRSYDSVVVVDADSLVSENILKVFNNYREQGAEVIQGYLTVPVKPKVWTSEIIRIGFTLYNYVRPLGRRRLGFSAGLRGNGMCFSMSTLKKIPWNAYSQTEDLEYGLELLLNDVEVVFAPEVIGYNQIPEDAKNAESQRERWEIGRLPVIKKFAGILLKESIKKRSFKVFDAFIDLITPPLVMLLLFIVMMIGVSFTFWWLNILESLLYTWIWMALLGCGIFHTLLGFKAAEADRTMYRSLLYVPRYALWKLHIYIKVLFKGSSKEWVRTARE